VWAALVAAMLASRAAAPIADEPQDILLFNDALGINNRGAIAGAGCTALCNTYEAFRVTGGSLDFLGTLGGFAALAFDINANGAVVGQADTADVDANEVPVSLAFVASRHDAAVRSLGTLPGYDHSQAFAINDLGEIVGWTYNTDFTQPGGVAPGARGFHVGADGVMRDIGSLGGSTVARDINNRGVIVGSSRTADGVTHAFVYEAGTMTALPGLGGRTSEALGINERGQVVGTSTYPGSNAARAVLWDRGSVVDLGTLGGLSARAWRINARGDIVGRARRADGAEHAFLYRDGTMHDLGTLGGRNSAAMDINDRGDIVGISQTGVIDPVFGPVSRGFVISQSGAMQDLQTVITEVR